MPTITTPELLNKQMNEKSPHFFPRHRTSLSDVEEADFQKWYGYWSETANISSDPDDPLHKYDYRGVYKAGITPQINPDDNLYHWPSEYKDWDHPNRFVEGVDTVTGKPIKRTITTEALFGKDPLFGIPRPPEPRETMIQRLKPVLQGISRLEDLMDEPQRASVKTYFDNAQNPELARTQVLAEMLLADDLGISRETAEMGFKDLTLQRFGKVMSPAQVVTELNPYPVVPQLKAGKEPNFFVKMWQAVSEKLGYGPDIGYYEGQGHLSREAARGPVGGTLMGRRPLQDKSEFQRKGLTEAAAHGITQAGMREVKGAYGTIQSIREGLQNITGEPAEADIAANEYSSIMAESADLWLAEHPEYQMQLQQNTGLLGTTWQFISRPELIIQGAIEAGPMMMKAYLGHITGAQGAQAIGTGTKVLPYAGRLAGLMQTQQGEVYADDRAAGMEPEKALAHSVITSAATAAIEEVTLSKKVEIFRHAAGRAMAGKIARGIVDLIQEGKRAYIRGTLEEGSQQLSENFWDMVFSDEPFGNDTARRLFKDVPEAAAAGGPIESFMSAGFYAGGKVVHFVVGRDEQIRRVKTLKDWIAENDSLTDEQKNELTEVVDEKIDEINTEKIISENGWKGPEAVRKEAEVVGRFKDQVRGIIDDEQIDELLISMTSLAAGQNQSLGQWIDEHIAGVEKTSAERFMAEYGIETEETPFQEETDEQRIIRETREELARQDAEKQIADEMAGIDTQSSSQRFVDETAERLNRELSQEKTDTSRDFVEKTAEKLEQAAEDDYTGPPEPLTPEQMAEVDATLEEMDAQEKAAESETIEKHFNENWRQMRDDYIETHENVVSTDEAKLQFADSGYAVEKSNDAAYQTAAGRLMNRVFDKMLKTRQGQGNGKILIMAGGSGSGKTTAVEQVNQEEIEDYSIVLDTNLDNAQSAAQKIEKAVNAGYQPEIVYVWRDPVTAWRDGVLIRVSEGGRYVPIEEHIRTHEQSIKTLVELADTYQDRIDIKVVDNSGRMEEAKIAENGIDFLRSIQYDIEDIRNQINEETTQQIQTGRLPEDRIPERRRSRRRGTSQGGPQPGQVGPDLLYQSEGLTDTQRKALIRQVKKQIIEHPLYKEFVEGFRPIAQEILSRFYRVDFGADIADVEDYIEGKRYLRQYIAKPDESATRWDVLALEAATTIGREITDVYEFISLIDEAHQALKETKGINQRAYERAKQAQDPSFTVLAGKLENLEAGRSLKEVNANVRKGMEYYGELEENIIKELLVPPNVKEPKPKTTVKKAATRFLSDGKAIIYAFELADFSSMVHELGHVYRRSLDRPTLDIIESWADVENSLWTAGAEEKFARAFERYFWEGKAPNQQMKSVFAKMREWMRKVYASVENSSIDVQIAEPVRRILDNAFSGPAEIHPGEMTFAEFFEKLGHELENGDSAWMRRYGLLTVETPRQMHKRLRDELKAAQAADLSKRRGEGFEDITFSDKQQAQLAEIEKSIAKIPDAIWKAEKAKTIGEVIQQGNQDYLLKREVKAQILKAFQSGEKTGIERAKKHYKDVLMRARARRELREHIKKLARQIAKPAPSTVDLYYREAIGVMQAGLDPSFRANKTLADRARIRKFLEKYPDHDLPKKLVAVLNKAAINEYTIDELQDMAKKKQTLEKQGKLKRSLRKDAERHEIETLVNEMLVRFSRRFKGKKAAKASLPPVNPADVEAVINEDKSVTMKYKGQILSKPMALRKGKTVEEVKESFIKWLEIGDEKPIIRSTTRKPIWTTTWQAMRAKTLTPATLFDMIDGEKANFDGPTVNAFVHEINRNWDSSLRMQDHRTQAGQEKLNELGLSVKDLAEKRNINGKEFTTQEIMGIYGYNKNPLSRLAIIFGNRIDARTLADIVHHCEVEDPRLAQLTDWIILEFDQHFERLEEAVIEHQERRLIKESNYLPMRRQELDYTPDEREILKEMLERQDLKKAYADKGFTIQRQDIDPEYQKPIRLDLWSLWLQQVKRQEHYIALAQKTANLHRILNNEDLQKAIKEHFGDEFVKEMRDYVSRVANPYIFRQYGFWPNASRVLRNHAAIAYLSYNLVTMLKQLPSALYYLPYCGVKYLGASFAEFVRNPVRMIEKVRVLDPQVRHPALERTLEELKIENDPAFELPETVKGIDRIAKRIGRAGFHGIYWMDAVARTIGWNAVYQYELARGASEADAVARAQFVTLRTQPAAAAKDIPGMYAKGGEAMNWLLMFSNQLNKMYNASTYDIPVWIRYGHITRAGLGILAMSLSGLVMWSIAHRRPPKDEEDLMEALGDQAINILPLLGNAWKAKRTGFGGEGIGAVDDTAEILNSLENILTLDGDEKDIIRILDATGTLLGWPVIGIKRALKAGAKLLEGEPGEAALETVGGEPKK
jgi:predicted ABC-type ATPase